MLALLVAVADSRGETSLVAAEAVAHCRRSNSMDVDDCGLALLLPP